VCVDTGKVACAGVGSACTADSDCCNSGGGNVKCAKASASAASGSCGIVLQ
jgi:hypothetical protein